MQLYSSVVGTQQRLPGPDTYEDDIHNSKVQLDLNWSFKCSIKLLFVLHEPCDLAMLLFPVQ